jgi:anion-transporting  ArsA/GET3 family ATPase
VATLTAGANVVIVAGKGGVGKTTVTAVLARAAADAGLHVLAVELDGKPDLAELLDGSGVEVRHLSPAAALAEYLVEHGFGRVAKRLTASGVIEVVSAAAPGIDDLVVLGKIKQLERSGGFDLILIDGPAAGHAVTLLTSPAGLLDAVRGGPVHSQAAEVTAMLRDPSRCRVVLVTLPEHLPVNELIETSDLVEDRAGVQLSGVVVNAVDTFPAVLEFDGLQGPTELVAAAVAAADYRRTRQLDEAEQIERLASAVPLPTEILPHESAGQQSSSRVPGERAEVQACGTNGPSPLAELLASARVIVCWGSGGVGKTTAAAVLGRQAARAGRRAVVVTIDPARRLADALGLPGGLTGEPQHVAVAEAAPGGELWATMLDTPAMFERVVRLHAATPDQADRIVGNRFFGNIAGALGGTQEYMASEALYELHDDPRFDLVVVDTPPSRHALDFLEAPGVLTRFLAHPLFRMMMLPTRAGLRVVGVATQPVLRTIGRVVGSDVLADTVAFFQAFAGMEAGFRERAEAVAALFHHPDTKFVLIATPRAATVAEAAWFADELTARRFPVAAVIVNRVQPTFGVADDAELPEADHPAWANLADLLRRAAAERAALALLAGPDRPPIVEVPRLAADVHGPEALDILATAMFRPPGG